jgi:hypothetical protein
MRNIRLALLLVLFGSAAKKLVTKMNKRQAV